MAASKSEAHWNPENGDPSIFPGFARIWACATLIHQLAFTFWAEAWPGWVLVLAAIAVLFQPACLYRFTWLIVASLVNLLNKLPFVPNHILFEGMLHVTMVLVIVEFLLKPSGRQFLKEAIHKDWKTWFFLAVVIAKTIYHLTPAIPKGYLQGSITTGLLLVAFGMFLFKRPPVRAGDLFIARAAPIIRVAAVIMYFWAAIQKMNRDYLNPEISCAAKLHIEIAHYFGELIPTKTWALHGAIWGSFFFEMAIPILLFIPRTRIAGFVAAVWFHLWLAIHPAAGIFSFSSLILALLYLFLPVGMWKQLQTVFGAQLKKVGGGDIRKGEKRTVLFVILFFFVILITQITMYTTVARSYEVFHTANRIGFIAFLTWGLWMGTCYVIAAMRGSGVENRFPNKAVRSIAWLGLLLVLLNGLSPWVGGKTQTAFSMYSNLRTEGQGNHLFLRRIDLLSFQRDLVEVVESEPNILDPAIRPKGIRNFANIGHRVLPYFEFRRLLTTTEGDLLVTYKHDGEVKQIMRKGEVTRGDSQTSRADPVDGSEVSLVSQIKRSRRADALHSLIFCSSDRV